MILLTPLLVSTAITFSPTGGATCPQPETPPAIRVNVEVTQPVVDHTKPRAQLKQVQVATASPYGNGDNVHVNGLMRGAITLETQSALAWQRSRDESVNCSWYNHVNIKLSLKPTIFVAAEIPQQSCIYREILNHEFKHYQTDFNIAKDYQVIFQDELKQFVDNTPVIGPYTKEQQSSVRRDLMNKLEKVIQTVNDRMKIDRIKRQSMIDTRQEYERVARACGGEAGML